MAAETLSRDQNFVTVIGGITDNAAQEIRMVRVDPVTNRVLVSITGAGTGTVTSVSVATANGFAGTVATATTTPAITISTSITGILQGNGTAISAVTIGAGLSFVGGTLSATGAGITVGTTTITSGTTTRILYDNAGVIGEYTISGSGTVVAMAASPVFTSPTLGVASATSLATSAASPFLLTNGQLITVALTSQTVGGATLTIPNFANVNDTFVFATLAQTLNNKTFVAPVLGAATATSINGNVFTTGTYTLTGTAGKTLTFSNSITIAGTDSTTMTFPSTNATVARTDAAQTFAGSQTYSNAIIYTNNAIAASGNAATVPVTARLSTVTNNSAATLTITMTTTSAVDGQMTTVRILDSSAATQTITWVNTENSAVTAPTVSNGSTTLFLTVGFIYNSATSKWRCIAVA